VQPWHAFGVAVLPERARGLLRLGGQVQRGVMHDRSQVDLDAPRSVFDGDQQQLLYGLMEPAGRCLHRAQRGLHGHGHRLASSV
jgi:hypothetical protein